MCRLAPRNADMPSSRPPAGFPEAVALPSLFLARVTTLEISRVGSARKETGKAPPTRGPVLGALPTAEYFPERRAHRGSSRQPREQDEPRLEADRSGCEAPVGHFQAVWPQDSGYPLCASSSVSLNSHSNPSPGAGMSAL